MSETPRYRCASEKGFFAEPTDIAFAKHDFQVGSGHRAEQDDEFDFEGVPGQWMDPINEAARQRVAELVADHKRASVNAPVAAQSTPVQPPKNMGMRAIDTDTFKDVRLPRLQEAQASPKLERAAPRRRAPKAN